MKDRHGDPIPDIPRTPVEILTRGRRFAEVRLSGWQYNLDNPCRTLAGDAEWRERCHFEVDRASHEIAAIDEAIAILTHTAPGGAQEGSDGK